MFNVTTVNRKEYSSSSSNIIMYLSYSMFYRIWNLQVGIIENKYTFNGKQDRKELWILTEETWSLQVAANFVLKIAKPVCRSLTRNSL